MPTSAIEWIVRMIMLVLAGLVTLSILGSIAAISIDAGPEAGGMVTERSGAPPAPEADAEAPVETAEAPIPTSEAPIEANLATGASGASAVPADPTRVDIGPSPRPETARWLEAIAYGLLALAGLIALAILLLWRGLRTLRRIADAAEAWPRNH